MFDVLDQAHAPQWRALRARFFADNEEVKAATKELIDTSFRKLRSAEGAFDLLQVLVLAAAALLRRAAAPHAATCLRQRFTAMHKLKHAQLLQFHRTVGVTQTETLTLNVAHC